MKKLFFFLALFLGIGGAATVSAQVFIPKASDDANTYEYYLQCAGTDNTYYASTTSGSASVTVDETETTYSTVEFTSTGDRLKIKLISTGTDGVYEIYATNLTNYDGTDVKIACTGTGGRSYVYFDTGSSSTSNNTWAVATGSATMSGSTTINGYTPYYSICVNGGTASWNRYGGNSATTNRLYDKTCNNSNWNFIPANLAALQAAANDINTYVNSAPKGYKATVTEELTTAISTATASDTYALTDAQTLLSAYSTSGATSYVIDLADGYYYIVGQDTGRYPYLFDDDFYESNTTNKYTLTSQNKITTNNGIWKITVSGNTLTLANGQGKTPSLLAKIEDGTNKISTSTLEVYTTNIVEDGYYCLIVPSTDVTLNSAYASTDNTDNVVGDYRMLDAWTATQYYNKADNRWTFESATTADDVYTVSIVNGTSSTVVTYTNSNNEKEYAYNGGFFVFTDTPDATSFSAPDITNYTTSIVVADNTIKVTYIPTSTVFDDNTTAPGVVPALNDDHSTTKPTYYLRNVGYSGTFLKVTAPTADNETGDADVTLTNTATEATAFAIRVATNEAKTVTKTDGEVSAKEIKTNGAQGFVISVATDFATDRKIQGAGAPNGVWAGAANDNASYSWTFEKVDGDDDIYLLYASYADGSTTKALTATAESSTDLLKYGTLDRTSTYYQWRLIPANDAAKAAAALTLEMLEGDDVHGNLATFSASYPVELPTGYTAYVAADDDNDNVIEMTEVTDGYIPANTGVILKGNVSTTIPMTPYLTYEESTTTSGLTATNETSVDISTLSGNTYCLSAYNSSQPNAGELAFFKFASGTIPANRAYLSLTDSEASAIAMSFGGTTTDIDRVVTEPTIADGANAPIYDLSGRILRELPQSGIYIRNGKKFIVK